MTLSSMPSKSSIRGERETRRPAFFSFFFFKNGNVRLVENPWSTGDVILGRVTTF